jgi:hypothetical protein
MIDSRLTTREAREVLGARNAAETIAILRAARVPATRCGGAWLWEAESVRTLALRLASDREHAPLPLQGRQP